MNWFYRFLAFTVLCIFTVPSNWVVGLWLLFRHPIEFHEFIREWRSFRVAIADVDEARTAGYYKLNRAQRRKLKRNIS